MAERRISMTVGRAVVGGYERAIREVCFPCGITVSFERSHRFFDPDTKLYVILCCDDGEYLDRMVMWLCNPKTWK
jgi:hypothetical protein